MTRWLRYRWIALVVAVLVPAAGLAEPLTTTHYRLDPDADSAFGGSATSGSSSYKITDAGGEAAVGTGSSGSYRLGGGYVAALQQSLQVAVLPSGLTAYYPLDTGIGVQAYDSGSAGRHGLLQNSPTWTTGKLSGALSFNGTNQYVSTSATFTNPSTFSLELWFKTNTGSGGRLIGFGDAVTGASTNADRQLYLTNAGNLVFGVKPSGTQHTITSTGTYTDNAWHHVVATLGSGGMHLYVDGSSAATPDTGTTTAQNYTGSWRLAYDTLTGWPSAPTSNYYSGTLDEVKIFSRELSATEVANDYAAGGAGVGSAQTIPQITAGISHTAATDVVIRTDAGGYNLAINQDHDLRHTDNTTTIAALANAIASPGLWTEGATKGLGFTLTGGSQIESGWGSSPNYKYAALPGTATTFHSRTGLLGGSPEATTLQFRLDVPAAQKSGAYSNTVTITATIIP